MWQMLNGRSGHDQCLFHLSLTDPVAFRELGKRVSSIPGKSREELMDSYYKWMREQARPTDTGADGVTSVNADDATALEVLSDGSPKSGCAATAAMSVSCNSFESATPVCKNYRHKRAYGICGLSVRNAIKTDLLSPVGRSAPSAERGGRTPRTHSTPKFGLP